MFNHSCNPNAFHIANEPFDSHMIFYSIKNIKKGEEITITYEKDIYLPTYVR
jgi:SET domain-containing protein